MTEKFVWSPALFKGTAGTACQGNWTFEVRRQSSILGVAQLWYAIDSTLARNKHISASNRHSFMGVAESRYDLCDQGMFWLPDLPRLRAIEIIGWIGNWNILKLKIMNY